MNTTGPLDPPAHTLSIAPDLCRIASEVAVLAGERIRSLREIGVSVAASKTSAIDIVTEADRESEQLIVEALRAARPDDGILGEEGTGIEGSSGVDWVIDPIDGTANYLYDLPAYAVSIAATVSAPVSALVSAASGIGTATEDGRRTIAGAVFNPRTGELFEAWAGGGSRLNGAALSISGQRDLSQSLVGTGFGYTVERKREQLEMLSRALPRVRDIRRFGSAAYDLCMLAAGRLDAYFERGLQPWDYAAGVLIAREAGAAILGRDNATRPGTSLLFAADPALVEQLRSVVLGD
ncbi:MAG: inositol monophosphatase family protein [Leucobacter sp.]